MKRMATVGLAFFLGAAAFAAEGTKSGKLPVGDLVHDGPATPEQISLFLPVTGALPQTATAKVQFRKSGAPKWTPGHSLYRIRPDLSNQPNVGKVPDAFAWPYIDMIPGTTYDFEVTVSDGGISEVKKASFTTRTLPPKAGPATKTIAAGSTFETIQNAFNQLSPGDVLQFQKGTYEVNGLRLDRAGTKDKPIYIRGESRGGVVLHDNDWQVIYLCNTSDVVIENMTLRGPGVDSLTQAHSLGVGFWGGGQTEFERVTLRNLTMSGIDKGVVAYRSVFACLVYENTLNGNNLWTPDFQNTNNGWNDDGINLAGHGNCVFNNTLSGFGDSLSYATHSGSATETEAVGVHFYRNDVRNGCDDFAEVDHSHRNNTLYDNRGHNVMTFISLDPLYGGPFVGARNICINTGRGPYKWNDQQSGQFILNNTVIRTTGAYQLKGALTAEAGWYQSNNGDQQAYGYQNNILIYLGAGYQTIRLDNKGHTLLDFTHNSWYPDKTFQWHDGTRGSLAEIQQALPSSTPVFSGSTKRHDHDTICDANPWTMQIKLGENFSVEVKETYTPVLAAGTTPKNSGVAIPNITDGFSGDAPDRGAVISGRPAVKYGDTSNAAATSAK